MTENSSWIPFTRRENQDETTFLRHICHLNIESYRHSRMKNLERCAFQVPISERHYKKLMIEVLDLYEMCERHIAEISKERSKIPTQR